MTPLKPSSAIVLFVAISCTAQTAPPQSEQPATVPTFDIASIHVHIPALYEGSKIIGSPNNSNFRTVNVTLKRIVQYAFDIPESRIVDAPAWMSSQPFDIDAKSDDDALNRRLHDLPSDQAKPIKAAMIEALLAQRFGLKTHREQRDLPIYALVAAKSGPKLTSSKFDGLLIHHGTDFLNAQGITLPIIARELSRDAGRVVIDKTGITGRFDIDLRWQPDDVAPGEDQTLPSLFTALQEQLGLRLGSTKGPVEVLVIDSVHEPSAN